MMPLNAAIVPTTSPKRPGEFNRHASGMSAAAALDRAHPSWSDITPASSSHSTSLSSVMHLNGAATPGDSLSNISYSGSTISTSSQPHSLLPGAGHTRLERSLAVVAPRSSSLHAMGGNQSKTGPLPPPLASTPPQTASKSTGSKLKRAFGVRRKKSGDGLAALGRTEKDMEQDSQQHHRQESQPIGDTSQSTPPSTQVTSLAHSHPKSAKRLTQLATHVMSKMNPKSPILSPIAPPPPQKSTKHVSSPPYHPSPLAPLDPHLTTSGPDHRSSIIPVTPAISSAVNFMRMEEQSELKDAGKMQDTTREKSDKAEMKETWRKSDSTNSHHTIRQVGASGSRTSRPVSMAESFQSTHTIVPVGKRRSALVGDADFGMAEEDDESFKSLDASSSSIAVAAMEAATSSPTPAIKNKNRRSMSLRLSSQFSKSLAAVSPPSASVTDLRFASSHSISEGVVPLPTPPPSGYQSHAINHNMPGTLATPGASDNSVPPLPSSRQERSLPALPPNSPSFRQAAISMTSGFAPAAGLAKRAVEKMGRAWGISSSSSTSGRSSPASVGTPPSSYSGSSYMDNNLTRTISNNSNASVPPVSQQQVQHNSKGKPRRTPNGSSGTHSVNSSSDSDAYLPPPGPILGRLVRGPLRTRAGALAAGGVVFGRDLGLVARETAVQADLLKDRKEVDDQLSIELRELEQRRVPAIVVRCAQHILVWGLQEEGLFRISGRSSHVARLRAEFDTGVDYDMTECNPGDLDPHAVASIFKAYLRELPESILTQRLYPYFEAVINQEVSSNQLESGGSSEPGTMRAGGSKGVGLPSSPRSGTGQPLTSIRKPPSLSTLAMPSFSSMPPPSDNLRNALKSLIAQLPVENKDLIRTVVDLIKATAKHNKETKMPLSNLLLVFCPSLNMTPSLLRALCDAENIWDYVPKEIPVIDIKRESVVLDIRGPKTDSPDAEDDEYEDACDEIEADSVQSEGASADHNSNYGDSSDGSLLMEDSDPRRRWTVIERPAIPTVYLDTRSHLSTSSIVSGNDRSTHSRDMSTTSSSVADDVSLSSDGYSAVSPDPIAASSPPPLSMSSESVTTPATSSGHPSSTHLPLDDLSNSYLSSKHDRNVSGVPKIVEYGSPLSSFSKRNGTPVEFPSQEHSPAIPVPSRRRSIPLLSLPSFSPLPSTAPSSPADPMAPRGLARSKKPSIRLLFSKRSSSSLSGLSTAKPLISAPLEQGAGPYMLTPRAASDSSFITPRSPKTSESSISKLPPVLDTPIEGPSLRLGLGFDDSPPTTAPLPSWTQKAAVESEAIGSPDKLGSITPMANRFHSSPGNSQSSLTSEASHASTHLRPNPNLRGRRFSVSSTASSNHLGLLDDDSEENWTQSVLLAAADVNLQ